MPTITVNGKTCDIAAGSTLLDLLSSRGIDPSHAVVEVDGLIVKKENFGTTPINPAAAIEILRFVGGG